MEKLYRKGIHCGNIGNPKKFYGKDEEPVETDLDLVRLI